jgi:ribA/ribD-fused uncharacterized protein
MQASADFTFFWGGASPLSQWHRSVFQIIEPWTRYEQRRRLQFTNAEQYMMAAKAAHFGDWTRYQRILSTTDPRAVKALGRQVNPFDSTAWSREARDYVRTGNLAKFGQNPELKAALLATGDTILVEASPYDCIWGIGLAETHPDARVPARWRGTNWLGEVLMEVRTALRAP